MLGKGMGASKRGGAVTPLQTLYSGTCLKRTLTEQKFLSALDRCPPWRGLN